MAIIGISGKINSGKDTVGQIIKIILDNPHLNNEGILVFLEKEIYNNEESPYYSSWQIKKFADKLKDIVCMFIGCTREQLEDREFKEKELGEEWDVYKITQYDFEYIIKYDEYNSYPIGEKIYSTKEEALKDVENQIKLNPNELNMDFFYEDLIPQKMTPRLLLQLLGTECGRQIIHPNIWVNVLFADYKAEEDYKAISEHFSNCRTESEKLDHHRIRVKGYFFNKYPNWIITDIRFPNELKAIKDREGITIRVNREIKHQVEALGGRTNVPEGYFPTNQHESETALDNAEFDYVIDNSGTLEDLIDKIKEILIKEKLLK